MSCQWFLRSLRHARGRAADIDNIRELVRAFIVDLSRFSRVSTPEEKQAVMRFMDSTLASAELQGHLPAADASFVYVTNFIAMWRDGNPRPRLYIAGLQEEYDWLRQTPYGPLDQEEMFVCEHAFYRLNH